MLTIMTALQKSKWPKDMYVTSMELTQQSMSDVYTQNLANNKDDVIQFIKDVRSKINTLPAQYVCLNDFCNIFVQQTGLEAQDFYLYHAFVEGMLDSFIAMKPNKGQPLFAYSFAIQNNIPGADKLYKDAQNLLYAVQSSDKSFSALTMYGLDSFFAVNEKNEFVAITGDRGEGYDYPDYDDDTFTQIVNGFADNTASEQLFNFYYNGKGQAVTDFMQTITQASSEIIAIYNQDNENNQKYFNIAKTYERITTQDSEDNQGENDYDSKMFAQAFLEADSADVVASDFRVITLERIITSDSMSFKSFWNQLQQYPMRSETSSGMVGFDNQVDSAKFILTKCNSVYDANDAVAGCMDVPPEVSAASVTCSILIIIAVIAAWIYGAMQAKKYDALNATLQN